MKSECDEGVDEFDWEGVKSEGYSPWFDKLGGGLYTGSEYWSKKKRGSLNDLFEAGFGLSMEEAQVMDPGFGERASGLMGKNSKEAGVWFKP